MGHLDSANWEKYYPTDLLINTSADSIIANSVSDKNYFTLPVPNLKIDSSYAFQFQYVFEDGEVSAWSPVKSITTSTESVPAAPTATVTGGAGFIKVELPTFPANALRVDVRIAGGTFGNGTVVATSFTSAGVKTIAALGAASPGNAYVVTLLTVTPSKINGDPSSPVTVYVTDVGETIQAPTNPNGFSIDRVLGGIQVNWAGTYANGTFTGFEAIKIYVGNSATATNGSYKDAGVMTGNNVANSITIPVDGVYLSYDLPVYIHAAAINKSGTVGTLQANVANNSLGARSAIGSDLADLIITNGKLVDDAVSAAKIATAAITTTKIADDAITTPKLVANAITADKIVSSAITADKIATNAITAGKILAGTIDVTKLAAGTISTNNLEAGVITSTSYIRAGSKNVGAGTGARVEISSSLIEDGVVDIAPGFYIYDSQGTAILSAPLTGGLSITGGGTFTGALSGASGSFTGNITASNGLFSVNNGVLTASSGTIGGWTITGSLLHSSTVSGGKIELNPATPKISLQQNGVDKITIDPIEGIKGPLIGGISAFQLQPNGSFSFGAGKIVFDGTTLTVQGSNLNLNITPNYDGTAGDNTVTQTAGGLLTTGRAFFYGATTDPRTGYYGSQIDTRYEYYQVTGGQAFDSTGPGLTRPFSAGDVWMQRE
jgi:hypothetical protein